MPQKTVQELFEERSGYLHNMRGTIDRAKKENRDLTDAEHDEMTGWQKKFEEANAAYSKLKNRGETLNWLEQQEKSLELPQGRRKSNPVTSKTGRGEMISWTPMEDCELRGRVKAKNTRNIRLAGSRGSDEYDAAFGSFLLTGSKKALSANFDSSEYSIHGGPALPDEYNYLQSDDDEKGGYTVPSEQFMSGLLREVDDQTWIWKNSRLIIVRQAQNLGIKKITSKMSTWAKGSELSSALDNLDTSLKFGKKSLTPAYFTGSARVSRDLLRSSTEDIDALVNSEFARDLGEVIENEDINGDGAGGPLGVLVDSADGISSARDTVTASASAFTVEELYDCKYSLKQQYRSRARWMFHRNRIANIAKLRDLSGGVGTGQFLWQPALRAGEPDTLMGLPVDENEFFPSTVVAGGYFGLLAVWEYYVHAVALDMEILRLVETRAATNEIEYVGRVKLDGMPVLEEAFARLQYHA